MLQLVISNIYLSLRFKSNHFANGLGFSLRYGPTNTSQWSYSMGACGGSFSTQNGIFTSPLYPKDYPIQADCIYTISQTNGNVISLNFLVMDTEACCDYLEIRDGPSKAAPLLAKLGGSVIPSPIQSNRHEVWMK